MTTRHDPLPPPCRRLSWYQFLACTVIVTLIAVVNWQVRNFEFINFDDPLYITENARVQTGLNWQNITWAFTTINMGFVLEMTGDFSGAIHHYNTAQ